MHIVSFDSQGKIAQIRQSWDQGALLKQVDVIGKTGRNWPIRDHNEQLRVITTCIKSPEVAPGSADAVDNRSRGGSNIRRDPHASLELFASREEQAKPPARVVSPYAGTRPRERSITQILGDEPSDDESNPHSRVHSESPSRAIAPKAGAGKNYMPNRLWDEEGEDDEETPGRGRARPVAPKIGAGKNFQPSRLFDAETEAHQQDNGPGKAKADRFVRPHPSRYSHFDLGDHEEQAKAEASASRSRSRSKHDSSWSFDDFVTPQKPRPSKTIRPQDVRHWDPEVDAASDTPGPYRTMAKPRRDAETHFDFVDDGPDGPRRAGKPRGAMQNEGSHLYDDKVTGEDGNNAGADSDALGNITNLKDRRKDFDSHWHMTDEPQDAVTPQPTKVSEDRKKAVKMMEANWAATDESPASEKENARAAVPGRKPADKKIAIAGDGMGSKKVDTNGGSDRSDRRGIAIAGDGMGNKKGTNRDWLYPEAD